MIRLNTCIIKKRLTKILKLLSYRFFTIKKPNSWTFLSYPLSQHLSGYGDGERIVIRKSKSIINGDSSNNTDISMSLHFGTHIDFPNHFSEKGKMVDSYEPSFFIFNEISLISIETLPVIDDFLIKPDHISKLIRHCSDQTDLLLIKTGFVTKRNLKEYWENGYGFGLGIAKLLRKRFPNLRAIGFDLISLNSYQQREVGRKSHKEFLIDYNILIIEDMNLSPISECTKFNKVIVSPLIVMNSEGAPVTVFANIKI